MSIKIFAGHNALSRLKEEGLSAEQLSLIVGASGGPKWLVLSKLDQYLNDHFLPKASQPIDLIGSSIGAWRMACYAQQNPSAAIQKLCEGYSSQVYEGRPSPARVSESAREILEGFLGDATDPDGHQDFIINNRSRRLNVVTVRNRLMFNHSSNLVQGLALGAAALVNPVRSAAVEKLFPRVVFSQESAASPYRNLKLKEQITLTSANLTPALAASGAIPFVLEPIKVPGSSDRWHWDGGLVDYHFAGPFKQSDDLVLYPHFYPKLIPGWLDKALPWRRVNPKAFDNVVVLCPSHEFIDTLPDQHVPERKDFEQYDTATRIKNWQRVIHLSEQLVGDLHDAMEKDGGRSLVQPLEHMS